MHLRHPLSGRRLRPAGFTLIEMLVSIGIILVMVGIALPIMNTMNNWSTVDAGVNTVGVAVQATRAYVDRERTGNSDPLVAPRESKPAAPFEGIAIIFAPSNEIRLARFDSGAAENPGAALPANRSLLTNGAIKRSGFEDIPNRDYIDVPSSVRIQGIIRVGTSNSEIRTYDPSSPTAKGNGLLLIDPPFAVRFDGNGNLISGRAEWVTGDHSEDSNLVYYNSGLDTETRGGVDYPKYEIDKDYGGFDYADYQTTKVWNSDFSRYEFDVEELDTVIGVRVIDPSLYDFENPETANPNSYRDIFFSRYTGSPMRNQ